MNRKLVAYFNPRSPHGERHTDDGTRIADMVFQSTLPTRGATLRAQAEARAEEISIHAPHTGSDTFEELYDKLMEHFNPRSPHGERRLRLQH